MRIGVTGASGFIGGHLMNALRQLPDVTVTPLIRKRKNVPPTLTELKNFVQDKHLIYHLSGVNRGSDEEILCGNILGTLRLLVAVKTHGSPETRIVFASSSQVYKHGKNTLKETHATEPESLYGISKKSAEDLLRLSGLPHIVLRLSNVYGPGCRPDYNSVIATFCDRAVRRLPLTVDGNGKQERDFIYIDDVVQALIEAGTKKQATMRAVYNVSSGRVFSLRQVIGNIKRAGVGVSVDYKNGDAGISFGCDPSRFQKNYNWKPKTSLSLGIKHTLAGFEEGQRS
jgi:nucleoside-diphosphate-sugar epimerase